MLFFTTSINYVDRQVHGLLAPTLQHSIGWTEAQYGYIVGAFQAAYAIGLVAAGRIVDRLGSRIGFALIMGWRAAFLATGIFAAMWIVWWLTRYHGPTAHPRVSRAELLHIQEDSAEPVGQIPWKKLLAYKQTWAYAAAKFLTDPVWYFYLYWLPKFFDERYHLGLGQIGLPLIIVYNFSAIGSIAGGWLSAALHKAGMSLAGARLSAMLVCACLILPILLSSRLSSLWSAVAILSLATAAHQGWSANLFTTASDMFPRSSVGVVVGIGGMAGSVGAVLFSLSTGWVLQSYHSYTPMFSIAAASYLLGLLLLRIIAPGLRRVDVAVSAGARLAHILSLCGPTAENSSS